MTHLLSNSTISLKILYGSEYFYTECCANWGSYLEIFVEWLAADSIQSLHKLRWKRAGNKLRSNTKGSYGNQQKSNGRSVCRRRQP
uniref:Uncharacterized protein n=1 Tax=Rhizophora mucronata TaxID=61149 RepID=A0A2P2KT59_RHIMU